MKNVIIFISLLACCSMACRKNAVETDGLPESVARMAAAPESPGCISVPGGCELQRFYSNPLTRVPLIYKTFDSTGRLIQIQLQPEIPGMVSSLSMSVRYSSDMLSTVAYFINLLTLDTVLRTRLNPCRQSLGYSSTYAVGTAVYRQTGTFTYDRTLVKSLSRTVNINALGYMDTRNYHYDSSYNLIKIAGSGYTRAYYYNSTWVRRPYYVSYWAPDEFPLQLLEAAGFLKTESSHQRTVMISYRGTTIVDTRQYVNQVTDSLHYLVSYDANDKNYRLHWYCRRS